MTEDTDTDDDSSTEMAVYSVYLEVDPDEPNHRRIPEILCEAGYRVQTVQRLDVLGIESIPKLEQELEDDG